MEARIAILRVASGRSAEFAEVSSHSGRPAIATGANDAAAHYQLQAADTLKQERPLHGQLDSAVWG